MKIAALFTALAGVFSGKRRPAVDNSVVLTLDLDKYLGSWYEIARYDHFFERGIQYAKATYTFREDGRIDVLNTGVKNGKPKAAKGIARLTDIPALLRVSFFGPFYADYRVMLLDTGYQYALVGSGSDKYLWILSRTPHLSEDVKAKILDEAVQRGYDPKKLIWVEQE